jgi:hypothetical protein
VANLPRPALLSAPIAAGQVIVAGFLAREADAVVAALGRAERERRVEGDWAAVLA